MHFIGHSGRTKAVSVRRADTLSTNAAVALIVLAGFAVMSIGDAQAGNKVRYPNIDYGELEIEHQFITTTDDEERDKDHAVVHKVEIGAGVLPFLFIEIEGEWEKEGGGDLNYEATAFESYIMLTQPGQYWADLAIFAEVERPRDNDSANKVELGLLVQKEHENFLHTLNIYWEHEVGAHAGNENTVEYAWQTRYRHSQWFQPGIEVFGEIEDVRHAGKFDDQEFRIGPMVAGSVNLSQVGGHGKIKYEVGYLFGIADADADGTLRTRFEYEVPFIK